MKYWLYSDGNILGPYEPADLLASPDFTEESLVSEENSKPDNRDEWKPASQIPEIAAILAPLIAASEKISQESFDAVETQEEDSVIQDAEEVSPESKKNISDLTDEILSEESIFADTADIPENKAAAEAEINADSENNSEKISDDTTYVLETENGSEIKKTDMAQPAETDAPLKTDTQTPVEFDKSESFKDFVRADASPAPYKDLLSSLNELLGEESKTEQTVPPKEIFDLEKDISDGLKEKPKKATTKEELESVRFEKDLLLGKMSLQEIEENNTKKRVSELAAKLKSESLKMGDKLPSDIADSIVYDVKGLKKDTEIPDIENFSDTFGLSDSKPNPFDIYNVPKNDIREDEKFDEGFYNTSNYGKNRPSIYVYEVKQSMGYSANNESVTKFKLLPDLSKSDRHDIDKNAFVAGLLPQQAGGLIYDFTVATPKDFAAEVQESRNAFAEANQTVIQTPDTEIETKPSVKTAPVVELLEPEQKTDSFESVKEAVEKHIEQSALSDDAGPGISAIRAGNLSSSKHAKLSKSDRAKISDLVPPPPPKQEPDEPLMQEVLPEEEQKPDKAEELVAVEAEKKDGKEFLDDEERLLQDAYDKLIAEETAKSKDQLQPVNDNFANIFNLKTEPAPAVSDSNNLLRAASIETIGRSVDNQFLISEPTASLAPSSIYDTPQQNVEVQDNFDSFLAQDPSMMFIGTETDLQEEAINEAGKKTPAVPAAQPTEFDDIYVGGASEETQATEETASAVNEVAQTEPDTEVKNTFDEHELPAATDNVQEAAMPEPVQQEEPAPQDAVTETVKKADIETKQVEPEQEENSVELSTEEAQAQRAEEDEKQPKKKVPVIKGVPSSISSIHRSFRTNSEITKEETPENKAEPLPDFNVEIASIDSNRLSSINNAAAIVKPQIPQEDALPILDIDDSQSGVGVVFELDKEKLKKSQEKSKKTADGVPVRYYSPDDVAAVEVKPTVALSTEKTESPIIIIQSAKGEIPQVSGTLSNVLNKAAKEDLQLIKAHPEENAYGRGRAGSKFLVIALVMVVCVLLAIIAVFVLGDGNLLKSKVKQDTMAQSSEQQPEQAEEKTESEISHPAQEVAQNNVEQTEVKQEPVTPELEDVKPVRVAPPVTPTDRIARAEDIVKNYKLSGGRGTISSWFANSFLSGSATTSGDEWSATQLHENIYVVQYRLARSRQDPLTYQFEVDIEKDEIIRGINNNAIDLLETSAKQTARAVPARKTFEGEEKQPEKQELKTKSKAKPVVAKKESLLQKAKRTLMPKRQKTYKPQELDQLPLPPPPKKTYSEPAPTGFEQPESDERINYLRAMESDEELF